MEDENRMVKTFKVFLEMFGQRLLLNGLPEFDAICSVKRWVIGLRKRADQFLLSNVTSVCKLF